jgi:hypothetical protein
MKRVPVRRSAVMMAITVVCLAGTIAAQTQAPPPPKIDVTGAWAFEVQTQAGTGTPQVTFKQDGEKLTGRYSSSVLGDADLTGSVKGQAIEFSLTANVQGNSLSVTYRGTVEDNNTMKGKVDFAGMGEGNFSGKRK